MSLTGSGLRHSPAPHGNRGRGFGPRYPNPHLVKINHSYTLEEAAVLLHKHKHTIGQWLKQGLAACKDRRPYLIRGTDLRAFLAAKRKQGKRRCRAGEMYCFHCRAPKLPAGGKVNYHPETDSLGNLTATCQDCSTPMNQRTSLAKLGRFNGIWVITVTQAQRRIDETTGPCLNRDYLKEQQS